MKIGRNDPCPCGSGKKYKRCCLLSSKVTYGNTVSIENSFSNFEHIQKNAKQLEGIISLYSLHDVTKAIFCINSWAKNRSALAQTLTLNQALCNIKTFGNKSINQYYEFRIFFESIQKYLEITCMEDLTLNDFGQVRIKLDGEAYPVILGTSFEQVYASMVFLPTLARRLGKIDDLKKILSYNRLIINKLANSNPCTENTITFELPSKLFWDEVKNLFSLSDFSNCISETSKIMGHQTGPIEMRHFFKSNGKYYPLFNTSILVDYYKKLLSIATKEEYVQHIEFTILSLLENSFNLSDNNPKRVLINPVIVNDSDRIPLLFTTVSGSKVLIAIMDNYDNDKDDITDIIKAINTLHQRNQLKLYETYPRQNGGYMIDVSSTLSLEYIIIIPFTDITTSNCFLGTKNDFFKCTALDLIYFIGFMDDFAELLDFITYYKNNQAQVLSFGGKSNLFFTWKQKHHYIMPGAIEATLLSVPYGLSDNYVFDYYVKYLADYPFNLASKLFDNPLNWKIEQGNLGYLHFEHKGCCGFGGEGKMLESTTFLFLAHNVDYFSKEDFHDNFQVALQTIDELNMRLFNRYSKIIGTIPLLRGKVLQLLFMPMHYAKKIDKSGFTLDKNKKFVYSDIYVDYPGTIIIRYTVNHESLLSAIMKSVDRSVEIEYFLELLHPLRTYINSSFDDLISFANKDIHKKKEVNVFEVERDYYYSSMTASVKLEPRNFARARKEISKVCLESGAKPGTYIGKSATKIIRDMQTAVVNVFEKELSEYDKFDLHKKVLSYYATQLNEAMTNLERYSSLKNLEASIQKELEKKIRSLREENRRNLRTAQYLLESNLAVVHHNRGLKCTDCELKNLLAFADWLVVLQDNGDTCFHTAFDIKIEIDSEYIINTILSDFALQQYSQLLQRKYNQIDYSINSDEVDVDFCQKCLIAFGEDTGIEMDTLIPLIEYLQLEVINKPFATEVYPNVFEVKKNELIDDCTQSFKEPMKGDKKRIEDALNFITLDCHKLKYLNGKFHDILPIWDREKRDNRFDVKPIIMNEDKYIFSPITLKQLATLWKSGFTEWYLPFEIGLNKVKANLTSWKKRYEDEMVKDIGNIFTLKNFNPVYLDIDFTSRFPKEGFPDELGDYDVIAINNQKKEIWLIESKVLQKVGSIYEDQMQQKDFFYQNKYDEKFQNRIDFFKQNLSKIATLLKLKIEVNEYNIIPYMVTNKLFASRYKKIDFPIISYHELKRKLEDY